MQRHAGDKETLLKRGRLPGPDAALFAGSHHIIGAAELAAMKPTAHLINVARGGVVDDGALIEALQRRHIAGAGLDVFERTGARSPFRALDNVVLTPHIGSSSRATRLAMAMWPPTT